MEKTKPRPRVLAVDIGGSHVKVRLSGQQEIREFESGPTLTARRCVRRLLELVGDWRYDVVAMGYPGVVTRNQIMTEPHNLAHGWVGFDFRKAFGRPTKIINDAAMQALGSYDGGRMLFLGLGTGLGTALIIDGVVEPMEIGHLPYKKGRTYEDYVGESARQRMGNKKWRAAVKAVVESFGSLLEVDYVVLGGGNSRKLKKLPAKARLGENDLAFLGGFRLWEKAGRDKRP